MEEKKNSFNVLSDINLTDKIKEKIGLKYLSWAYAWGELKKNYPDASMTVYSRKVLTEKTITTEDSGQTIVTKVSYEDEVPYFTDGKTCYVKVGVTVQGVEYIELLPVMDNKNNAIALTLVTMTAVNKAIQRAFVKACARHGLGLYIYAGEDLPESERKIIDFKAIGERCDRYQTQVLSDEGFKVMLDEVIQLISAQYPEDAAAAIVDYTVKQTKGKKLSLFTNEEDSQKLQRIYNFINEVKKELAAPSGK